MPSSMRRGAAHTEGPSGQVDKRNIMFKYAVKLGKGFSVGASLEVPTAGYQLTASERAIDQRCPDIPAYIQYAWGKNDSHVRLSGIFRRMSYRDLVEEENRFESGWGVQFSTIANIIGGLEPIFLFLGPKAGADSGTA